MDFNEHLREMVAHLIKLDRTPGWQDYVRERLKELRRADSMYAALPGLIRELLNEAGGEGGPEPAGDRGGAAEGGRVRAKPCRGG